MRPLPTKKKGISRSSIRWGVAGIFALLVIATAYDAPTQFNRAIAAVNSRLPIGLPTIPEKRYSLGLDLQGGAHLVYRANMDHIAEGDRSQALEGVRDVVERRVNGLGVGETNVQTGKVGDTHQLIVELPGVTDVNQAIGMIGATPILEFKEENPVTQQPELTAEQKKQLDAHNADAKKRANDILKRVQKGEAFDAVAKEVSEDEQSKNNGGYLGYVRSGNPVIDPIYTWANSVKANATGATVIENPEGFNIVKRGADRMGETEVKASHILICYLGVAGCDATMTKDEALAKAKELYDAANAKNFAELAKTNSSDMTKETGGDLGYFTKAEMVPEFAEAAFKAKVGEIVGPVETQFGYHIIYKTGEQPMKEIELSRILVKTQTAADILPPLDPWKTTGLSGKQLKHASVATDQRTGEVQVSLQFDGEGTDLFRDITQRNIGKFVAILLDGEIITQPRVNQAIPNGQAVISGNFTLSEAQLLSQRLNAGALPVPVELISQQTVGATLGAASLQASLKAGVIALLLVMLFMVLYYRLPGVIAVVGLLVYASVSMAIFKLMGVTMTLAGIAGFILSIGMAVDANILVFERMKEELRGGRTLRSAVEEGFLRAWLSIRDGNMSVLITCFILVWFGSSFVKGFAVTLAVGTLVSIFSAITVTRMLLRFIVPWFKENGNWLFLGYKK